MKLKVAENFSLPEQALTETFGILAKRGMGKSYTAMVLAEEMLKAKMQVVAVDPTSAWWGLRVSSDGKGPGLPIIVMGGDRGDVPLEETAGKVVAEFVVEHRASVVLDLSIFRKGEQIRFMTDFSETLYHRNRNPMHLFIDECDLFAPQRPMHGQERLLGAIEDIVRRGRIKGLGVTLVSQRSAVVNKNVLTQVETLILLRTLSPQDREAAEEWIKVHAVESEKQEVMGTLHTLPRGTAWVWSPGWLETLKRVEIRKRETFDSSATPKPGEKRYVPKELSPVDLEALKQKMAATIEKAKAEDPRELRRQIAELKKQMGSMPAKVDQGAVQEAVRRETSNLARQVERYKKELERVHRQLDNWASQAKDSSDSVLGVINNGNVSDEFVFVPRNNGGVSPSTPKVLPKPKLTQQPGYPLTGPEARILNSIAWMNTIGVEEPEQTAVAFLAGYSFGGGAYNNPRGALRVRGLVEYSGSRIRLTEEGKRIAVAPDAPLDSETLQSMVMDRLPGPERRILKVLIDAWPESVANEDCARMANYEPGGGAYNNPRGRLRSLGLIEYTGQSQIRARDILFLR